MGFLRLILSACFCPGNEGLNNEILRMDSQGNILRANSSGDTKSIADWEIRIIPNKFAALENTTVYRHKEFYVSHSGDGDHEVIITQKA